MPSIRQMADNVRLRLGEPRSQRPSRRAVLQAVCTHVQSAIFNRLGATGKPWTIEQVTLPVAANQGTYTLNVGTEFGRAVDVYTSDPGNPSHIERSIPFWNLQDLQFNWGYPENIASSFLTPDGSPNTADRIAFYRNSVGDISARILPMPQLAASYVVLFTVGNFIETASLDSSPLLSEAHMLPEVRAALSLLPQTEWCDDKAENRAMRKDFGITLEAQNQIFTADFENMIRAQQGSKMSHVFTLSFD